MKQNNISTIQYSKLYSVYFIHLCLFIAFLLTNIISIGNILLGLGIILGQTVILTSFYKAIKTGEMFPQYGVIYTREKNPIYFFLHVLSSCIVYIGLSVFQIIKII